MEDKVLRNIQKTTIECECALIDISIHFSSLTKNKAF